MCPANFASGGPELLHQLAFELRKLGIEAIMFYVDGNTDNVVHGNYVFYNIPYVESVEDISDNVIIFPETNLKYLNNFHKVRKVIWWLSVDNSLVQFDLVSLLFDRKKVLRRILCKLILLFSKLPLLDKLYKDFPLRYLKKLLVNEGANKITHLAQSVYAMQFLSSFGINSHYLSDYLREDYLVKSNIDLSTKEDIIVYNPKKGYEFTKEIIKQSKSRLKFVAIENMTIEEVTNLLIRAKVYIDFGCHPGKDRIPREAALMKCCVVTGKKGSAKFFEDLPIPDAYKFEDDIKEIPLIIDRIQYCLDNYTDVIKDFANYCDYIYSEPIKFKSNIKEIFIPLC